MAKSKFGHMACPDCDPALKKRVVVKINEAKTLSWGCDECDGSDYARPHQRKYDTWVSRIERTAPIEEEKPAPAAKPAAPGKPAAGDKPAAPKMPWMPCQLKQMLLISNCSRSTKSSTNSSLSGACPPPKPSYTS